MLSPQQPHQLLPAFYQPASGKTTQISAETSFSLLIYTTPSQCLFPISWLSRCLWVKSTFALTASEYKPAQTAWSVLLMEQAELEGGGVQLVVW